MKVTKDQYIQDAQSLSAAYLINNIDEGFNTWKSTPWSNQIDFSTFCQHILPYRIQNEPISNWRKILRKKYAPYIVNIQSAEEAFILIYNKVMDEFKKGENDYPHQMDILMLDRIMKGNCMDRSLYMTSVMRALSIPAAYDYVPYWANFTSNGHSWVAYIRNDSTFIPTNDRQSLELYGVIDASHFYQKTHNYNTQELAYNVDSVKRAGKVFRSGYAIRQDHLTFIQESKEEIPSLFIDPFLEDVSAQYGLSESRVFTTSTQQNIYLCNFIAGKSWQPVQISKAINGRLSLNNLNKNVVYLAATYSAGHFIAIAPPFYINSLGNIHEFKPDQIKKVKIKLYRKHVLTCHWTDRWSPFLGGKFEGSNSPNFDRSDVLYEINKLPTGIEYIIFSTPKKHRYIRFVAPKDSDPNFAEIKFLGKSSLSDTVKHVLSGKLLSEGINEISLNRGMDGDYATFFRMTNTPGIPKKNYWFGYDLGTHNTSLFTGVEFCPINDQNMIEPGNLYELFYFENKWISIGHQVATENYLIFDNVPSGSLLWLKNKTKGKEERIFTYIDDKQKWW